MLGLSSVFAQEWSAAQKEVWNNVNTYWGLMAKGDINGFLDYSEAKETQDGKKSSESGRWTDILLKQGTKWVMIGDHGGSDKKE